MSDVPPPKVTYYYDAQPGHRPSPLRHLGDLIDGIAFSDLPIYRYICSSFRATHLYTTCDLAYPTGAEVLDDLIV